MSVDCRLDKSITNDVATKEKAADDFQEMLFREKAKAQSSEESVFVQKQGQADVSGIHTRVHTIPLCSEQETQRSNCFWGHSRRTGPYFSLYASLRWLTTACIILISKNRLNR